MKKLIWALGLLLVGVILYVLSAPPEGDEPPLKVDFKTTDVLQGEFINRISAKGVVEPKFKVEVKSKASGEVLKFPLQAGDFVKRGQLMIQLDKSDEKRNVAKARAELASSQAKLQKARSSLLLQKTRYATDLQAADSAVGAAEASLKEAADKQRRQRDLYEKQFASREALDAAETEFKVQTENLTQARARAQAARDAVHDIAIKEDEIALAQAEAERTQITLDEALERLEETEIFAPLSGVILEKQVEEGQIIASGISNVSGGTPLATLADISTLYITADVDETDIGKVRKGQKVEISADAFPGEVAPGVVERIAPQGLVESSITVFKVKIEIQGEGRTRLKPMMSANIDIIINRVPDAVYVSRAGVREGKTGRVAMVLENGEAREIPIETGLENPIHVQILSGLAPGQKVITGDWEKAIEEAKSARQGGSSLRKILWMIRSR